MKRQLPKIVILFVFFLGLVFGLRNILSSFAFDGFNNHIILSQSGKVSIFTFPKSPSCDGRLSLYHPYEKLILSSLTPPEGEEGVNVGYFNAGEEIIFKLELDGSSPDCSGSFLSTSADFGTLISSIENLWLFVESDYLYFLLVRLEPSAPPPPSHHPVIFIHGLGGVPSDWITGNKSVYFDTLKAAPYNYPSDYLVAYPYADADGNPETYDYQGDVAKLDDDLPEQVERLSALHLADGGDGKVDLVGFSLGGLVARQYLNTHPANHKIRKVITIGSPHEGAWLLSYQNWADLIPGIGQYLRNALNKIAGGLLQGIGLATLDLNSDAVQQVRSASNFLNLLNTVTLDNLSYDAVYGDIDAELQQKLFFFTLKKKVSIGDVFILPDSATGIPTGNLTAHGFSDEEALRLNIRPRKINTGGYEYVIDVPSFDDLRFYHGSLITQPEVVETVINVLTSE